MPVLSIVLPTYNEAGHIQELLQELIVACRGIDHEILVVDDNSPDGTHVRVAEYSRSHPEVVPVLRTRVRGLATAVMEGFRRARGDYVVVMDSDGQHPPEAVPRLLETARERQADLVVASRYATGASVQEFPRPRRVISWGAKTLAVVSLARVRQFRITDPMSGFFLVRRAVVDADDLRPRGYKILIEILARSPIQRAAEVGYAFRPRRSGQSKLGLRTQWDYFWHVLGLGLRDRENQRIMLFVMVGLTGILVNVLVYEGAKWLLDLKAASEALLLIPAALARETSILWNFAWNDATTFRDLRPHAQAGFLERVFRFNLVSLLAFGAYLLLFYLFLRAGVPDLIALLIAILVTFLINYGGNRRWTYARRADATRP